jgi:hypothetical protein
MPRGQRRANGEGLQLLMESKSGMPSLIASVQPGSGASSPRNKTRKKKAHRLEMKGLKCLHFQMVELAT